MEDKFDKAFNKVLDVISNIAIRLKSVFLWLAVVAITIFLGNRILVRNFASSYHNSPTFMIAYTGIFICVVVVTCCSVIVHKVSKISRCKKCCSCNCNPSLKK